MMTHPLLLISGVPSTGKTAFGNWLQETKSFIHVDIEKTQCIPTPGSLDALSRSQSVILTWGFFPGNAELKTVEVLKSHGVSIWWFTADASVAREDFIRRGESDVSLFDYQMSSIQKEWKKIEKLFSPNILVTLDRQGRLTCEMIYQKIMTTFSLENNLRH